MLIVLIELNGNKIELSERFWFRLHRLITSHLNIISKTIG